MPNVAIRWRSSGGRGEFEYVPADALTDRNVLVYIEALGVTLPAEVRGVRDPSQGKPRLRKFNANDRNKLHLPQLVAAAARLPEPRREDTGQPVVFPLENKSFLIDEVLFELVDDDGVDVLLAPLKVSVLHSLFVVNLQDRFAAIAKDMENIAFVEESQPDLAAAIRCHVDILRRGVNSTEIRRAADVIAVLQTSIYGATNAASATVLEETIRKPEADIEGDIVGVEGRLLARVHSYRERDRKLAERAKQHYRSLNGGFLVCQACRMHPTSRYGTAGDRCIEAHHIVPIEELQPDSITTVAELAMVCASCHRIIHSQRPCLTVAEVSAILGPYSA